MLVFDGGRLREVSGREVDWPDLAVFGDPVAHSLSPRLHTAALRARGLDHDYAAVRVRADDLAACLDAAAEHGMLGLNLTVPHKRNGLALSEHLSDEVREIGAANTLVRRRDRWHAHNTDARGLALALQSWRGRRLARSLDHVVVIGSGGAARSAVVCARALGSRRIRVLARRPERATWAAAMGAVADRKSVV
jgi:shikimate dehydrogenase